MASETKLLRLALAAYEAAAEPVLWLAFLKGCAEVLSAEAAHLQIHNLGRHSSAILSQFGVSSSLKSSYNEYYSRVNIWRERGRPLYIPGRVNLDQEQCPRSDLERSEFYNDCLKPSGLAYSLGAVIAREGDLASTLTSLRSRRQKPFGEEERKTAQFLLPHIRRAWVIQTRMEMFKAGESVLDAFQHGIVFLTVDGTAIHWNRAADDIFKKDDGLSLRNGLLSATDRAAEGKIREAIGSALSPRKIRGPAAVAVPRASFGRDYQVVAAPLLARPKQFEGIPGPRAVILITDPESKEPALADVLIQLYRLTPKEAGLASKLAEGVSIQEAADELSITYETARTHLRRIFGKTGTSRQAELLLLLARLPGFRTVNLNG